MPLLPFGALPPYKPRRFVPRQAELGEWAHLAPLFDLLDQRAGQCQAPAEFERLLLDWSELSAALDEESTRRYVAMTCHTEDSQAEAAYLHFVEHIEPRVKPRQFALARAYVNHPLHSQLPRVRYEVFNRDTQAQVALFRTENVPLETEEAKLGQQYQKLSASLTAHFRGEEQTLVRMGRYLEEPDRATRKEAWELVANRRLAEAGKFDDIFDQLVRLRNQIARNAGCEDYRDYAFRKLCRFDYTPADCEAFHGAVEAEVMPILRQLQTERRQRLGLEVLKPWDLAVDPLSRPPLRPFDQVGELVQKTQRIFQLLDGELAQEFRLMEEMRLLDLDNRKGKAPGGYQSTLAEARLPFIFMNAVGIQRDVETLLHEGGHAFHALAARDDELLAYRSAPIEFCEVASMSMEMLGQEPELLREFYSEEDTQRAWRAHLESIFTKLAWIALVDAFQHWLYKYPAHTRAERDAAWLELMGRFDGDVDWQGCEAAKTKLWHRQLHIFLNAFYYIEYGIAQLGALQVWANSRRDKLTAVHQYKSALRLGGSRPLPALFSAAGCKLAFDRQTLGPLASLVREELASLPA